MVHRRQVVERNSCFLNAREEVRDRSGVDRIGQDRDLAQPDQDRGVIDESDGVWHMERQNVKDYLNTRQLRRSHGADGSRIDGEEIFVDIIL